MESELYPEQMESRYQMVSRHEMESRLEMEYQKEGLNLDCKSYYLNKCCNCDWYNRNFLQHILFWCFVGKMALTSGHSFLHI